MAMRAERAVLRRLGTGQRRRRSRQPAGSHGTARRVLPLHLRRAPGLARLPGCHDDTTPLPAPDYADGSWPDDLRLSRLPIRRVVLRPPPGPHGVVGRGLLLVSGAERRPVAV